MRKGQQLYRCKDCKHQFFDNGKLPRMRKPKVAVAAGLRMYFDGCSSRKAGRNLRSFFWVSAQGRSILRWIQKYVPQVDVFLWNFPPRLSGLWHMDETVLKFRPSEPLTDEQRTRKVRRPGEEWWQWDAIDRDTRFVVGTRISKSRTYEDGLAFVRTCDDYAPRPHTIVTDDLMVYPRVLRRVFWTLHSDRRMRHIHTKGGFRENQPIERFHGTLKDRVKAMRGLKSPESRIPRGIAIDYNFVRPHLSIAA